MADMWLGGITGLLDQRTEECMAARYEAWTLVGKMTGWMGSRPIGWTMAGQRLVGLLGGLID